MKNIFIIHGSKGYPEENWFPWLKKELEKFPGLTVTVPQFQVPDGDIQGGHHYNEWLSLLSQYRDLINEETIFIGHSRGCGFIMHALIDLKIAKIAGLFLVAPWIQYRWYDSPNNKVESFHMIPIDWASLKKISSHTEVFQSKNDVIPIEEGIGIAAMLEAHLELVTDAGHFNTLAGYNTFPLLLKRIILVLN